MNKKIDLKYNELDKKIDLKHNKLNEKIIKIEEDIKDLKFCVNKIFNILNVITSKLDIKFNQVFFQTNSPLSLTEIGKELLLKSGALDFMEKNKKDLIKEIINRDPKSAYDVQEICKQVIFEKVNTDDFIPLKDYIYEESLTLDILVISMGLYLRDKVLIKLEMPKTIIRPENRLTYKLSLA